MNLFYIVFAPMIGALIPLLLRRTSRPVKTIATIAIPISCILVAWPLAQQTLAGDIPTAIQQWLPNIDFDLAFRLDGLSLLFVSLILGIGVLIVLYAHYYLSSKDNDSRFYACLLLFMSSMLGIVTADNVLLMWAFWELTSISSFLLIGYWYHQSDARRGARMALATTGAGGLALLAGLLIIGHIAGSYQLDAIFAAKDAIQAHSLYIPALILVLLGAFTKSAQFPFQFWLPHAMAAPTPVSAYLHSATMVKAGIFLLARMHPALAGTEFWFITVTLIGLITMLVGAYFALLKHDLKGLLAFSTVSHLGLICMLLGIGSQAAVIAALFHVINHACFKAGLFMTAGIIDHEAGTRDMRKLQGLLKFMPITATLAMIVTASMAGVPPFNGFMSKELFLDQALNQHLFGGLSWFVPVLATVGAALSVAYSIRFIHDVFFNGGYKELPKQPHDPPKMMALPVLILSLMCIIIGLLPMLTVSGILNQAVSSVVLDNITVKLALWHGFNLPLLMSAVAIVGGIVIYSQRDQLFTFNRQFEGQDAKHNFERIVQSICDSANKLFTYIDTGSLQRYMALVLISVIVLVIPQLFEIVTLEGSREQLPVDFVSIVGASVLMVAGFATAVLHRHRFIMLMMLSVVGLVVSLSFAHFSAPDLAMTQLVVEVVSIILMVLALFFMPQKTARASTGHRVFRDILIASLIGGIVATLNYGILTSDFETISDFFIANAKTGGGGTNVVNVILVDFRGFDTLGEITVLAIAAAGIHKLLNKLKPFMPSSDIDGRPWHRIKHPLMLTNVANLILPMAMVVAVYIFLRGHNLPGGGFIAGLIAASAMILQYIANGVDWVKERFNVNYQSLMSFGVMIAALTGVGSWFFDRPFLTSWFTYLKWPLVGKFEFATALLFDLGVFLTVIGATMMILSNFGKMTTRHRPRQEGN
ncbi:MULTISPECIES: monovalent cation/H+ antiporter subunit A [unclassified Idiomarina]|jgi:multicomponent K+:H+ antiporter subunit A|uniref:monovalent cation/H+ antiporter subunit A n=1 Tax=unclassified Idiomarina TaxID=2614829 RepID=UPI000C8B4A4D|nr:monovalent cation/H+ antiporter subunit A [Idiomarina sp. UBA3162]MAD53403.1 monovalent cation/H+ antiporter subunit A [Idiomarinaceae bacterium]MEC9320379.1 monovalent cation/H+ antiporter subunit A [Pseudomonadota bacterium]